MAFRGIIFDFDGTLANTTPLILATFHQTLGHFYPELTITDQDIIHTFGMPLREGLGQLVGLPATGAAIEKIVDYYRQYNYAWHDKMIRSFPGVKEGLQQLKALQVPMIVVTSKLHDTCLRGLRCLDLDPYIKEIVGYEQCTDHKPAPAPMLVGCKKLRLSPEEVLTVGDSPFDMVSGTRAGCKTVKVAWSSFTQDFFDQYGTPDYVIQNIGELARIIKNNIKR